MNWREQQASHNYCLGLGQLNWSFFLCSNAFYLPGTHDLHRAVGDIVWRGEPSGRHSLGNHARIFQLLAVR